MKKSIQSLITLISVAWLNTGFATPITANSGVSFYNDMVIASGGQLPIGLEVVSISLDGDFLSTSELQASDALDFNISDVTINGLGPDTPSIFSDFSSSTRNSGTEGAASSSNTQLYQILESEIQPDGDSDVSERGIWGDGNAQAAINTEFYATNASTDVSFERVFTISNGNPFAMTFGIEGIFEMDLFATAEGENSFAHTVASLDMFFSSSSLLDIVFADTSLYTNNQNEVGDNTFMSLFREIDVSNTGHLSLTGNASATGNNSGAEQQAFGNGAMSYALGITLLPGEEITMTHLISYENFASIAEPTIDVEEPSTLLLMLFMSGIAIARKQLAA
jgi:hypothetical protein